MMKKIFSLCILAVTVFYVFIPNITHAITLTPIRFEVSGDPGQVLSEEVTLYNERQTAETYYSSYENFEAQGETGSPTWVPAKEDLGTWMKTPDSIFIAPGQTKIVPVTITIPKNAEPGGHFAGVFWGTSPKVQTGGQVAIGAKTGVLVLLSVSGPINEKGGILEFSTKDHKTSYNSLPIDFYYRFENGGSDRIKPTGNIIIKNILGITSAKVSGNPIEGNILPRSVRKIETSWNGLDIPDINAPDLQLSFWDSVTHEWRNFALGRYTANLSLVYGTKKDVASADFSFWVWPWQLVLVFITSLLIAIFIIRTIIVHYNNWVISRAEKMLEKMQEEKNTKEHPIVKAGKVVKKVVLPKKRKRIQ